MTRETPQQAAARAQTAERLAAHRAARATICADVRRAAELGMGPTAIAREAGLTPLGVRKILARDPSEDPKRPD